VECDDLSVDRQQQERGSGERRDAPDHRRDRSLARGEPAEHERTDGERERDRQSRPERCKSVER
jgi:hypothetical protein